MKTDRGPVFIGGLDRSGKTLLRLALSSHPNIAMTRRTYMWRRYFTRFGDLSNPADFEQCLSEMLEDQNILALDPDPEWLRNEFSNGELTVGRLFSLLHEHFASRNGKIRWGEQEGSIERFADEIYRIYPAAKIIHMIRDPRARFGEDVLASKSNFRFGKAGPMIGTWLQSIRIGLQNVKRYPLDYKILRYEDLLTRPEETLKDLCLFIGEEYFSAMRTLEGAIRFGREKRSDAAPGWSEEKVRNSLNVSVVLSKREIRFMQNFAGEEMLWHKYDALETQFSFLDGVLYLLEWPVNYVRMKALSDFEIN